MHVPEFTQQILHEDEEARGPTQTPLGYSNPNDLETKTVHCGHRCHTSNLRGGQGTLSMAAQRTALSGSPVPTTPYGIYQAHFLPLPIWSLSST